MTAGRCAQNAFSAAGVFGACFSLHFVGPVWVKNCTQRGRRAGQKEAQTDIAVPLGRKAGERGEAHTSAPLDACPCHQLSA